MFSIGFNMFCIGAAVFGLLVGYMFAYSSRGEKPTGNELAGLFGTVLGGAALTLLERFMECKEALPLYVIGVAVGYLAYVIILNRKWHLVQHLRSNHGLARPPLFPRDNLDPCYRHMQGETRCACNQCGQQPRPPQ